MKKLVRGNLFRELIYFVCDKNLLVKTHKQGHEGRNTNKLKNFYNSVRTILIKAAIILLLPFNLFGQSQFNKSFDFNNTWSEWGMSINIDSNLFSILRGAWPLSNSNSSLIFSKFDLNGNPVSEIVIDTLVIGRYSMGLSHCVRKIDNKYVGVGSISRPLPYQYRGFLIKIDLNGDTSFIKTYLGDSLLFIANNFSFCSDSGYAIIGTVKDTGTGSNSKTEIYLLKTDSNGNELWHKSYGAPAINDEGYCVFELPNKNLIIGGEKKLTPTHWAPWIIITDSAGNMVDQKLWNTGAMYSWGGYLNIGLKNQMIKYGTLDTVINTGDFPQPTYLGELNNDFSFKWRTIFNATEQNAPYIAKQLEDSSIVIIGVMFDPVDSNGSHPQGWIAKLDKDGNFLWEHLYKYCISQFNYFADFQQLPDGGFIVSGSTDGCDSTGTQMTNQDLWLVRIDSNGCLVPGCITNAGTIETGRSYLNLYPNPAQDELHIAWWMNSSQKVELIIYNLLGQQVVRNEITSNNEEVNIGALANGFYILQISNGKQRMQSKFLKQ